MDTTTETNPIDAAQASGVFDVLSFIEQTAYPSEDVVLFQDVKSADEYVKISQLEGAKSDKLPALADKIKASSIIFTLRGMPPGVVGKILEAPKNEEPGEAETSERERENELIAKTIVSVKNSTGVADTKVPDAEYVDTIRTYIKEGEFAKLIKGVMDVNFNAMVFDNATDAGFSG